MKIRHYIYLVMAVMLAACSEEPWEERPLTSAQTQLMGLGVNFNTSIAEPFTTRTTYRRDGSFNEGDVLTIYRQYSENDGLSFDAATEAYRVYLLTTKYAPGTSFALETDWRPLPGATGHNPNTTDYPTDRRGDFTQTEADSLTWENGKTVRFRSWSRSNLAGAIDNGSKEYYYPDYCVSDWVTVSGPTLDVPLTLKHQGCRIEFVAKSGNELYKAEICTDVDDYRWKDNNTNREHDDAASEHGKSLTQAIEEATAVKAVYDQMCMPAGADVTKSLLTTMTQELYDATTNFSNISNSPTGIVALGEKTPEQIRDEVQRPVFCKNDGRLDLITIPYNMSNDERQGESLTLPPCTRIKVWLYDVNDGDRARTGGTEAIYHIFTLSDIMDKRGGEEGREQLFPEGMELKPGYSYRFDVGYQYDRFTITPADDFSWENQEAESGTATDEAQTKVETTTYTWWKDAIKAAIKLTQEDQSKNYNPVYHISTQAEFLEFIKLVNGTAVETYVKEHPMVYVPRPEKNYNRVNPVLDSDYRWYLESDVVDGKVREGADSVTHEFAIEKGYIFYQHYHPANADQAAYSIEDYLRAPYSFFNEDLNRRFVVYLDKNLDFYDWQLDPIGDEDPSVRLTASDSHPFRGIFDGQMHTLSNVNMRGGYMFRHCFDAAIRNLKVETTHNFMLLNTAEAKTESTGYGAYIVGISIKAPSSGNPIARVLQGNSYVVGCIYEGAAGGAMVGTANNLYMYGNMMAATGLPHNSGALLGSYADASVPFLAPQTGTKVEWGRFMANYYLMDRYGSDTDIYHAVGTIPDAYSPQEYIRGGLAWVLKAKNDNMLSTEVPYSRLTTELMRKGYYGLAPWKAMNYAIKLYNDVGAEVSEAHNCKAHFVNDNAGYSHTFPRLIAGEPNSAEDATGLNYEDGSLNILELNN